MRIRCKPLFCLPALLLVVPVAFSSACAVDTGPSDPTEELSQHTSALVDTDSPWVGPSRDGVIPALPGLVSGARPPEAAVNAQTSRDLHSGIYLNGRDLRSAPDRFAATDEDDVASWLSRIEGDDYTSSEAYRTHMQSALEDARGRTGTLDTGYLDEVFDGLGGLGGSTTLHEPTTTVTAPPSARARWLAAQWACPPGSTCAWTGERKYNYEDPEHFAEIRERGARQYCAAREAMFHQGSTVASMGEQSATSFRLFGRDIDLLVLEPTVAMSPPQRFTGDGADDGAQAFAIPVLVGTKVTPIRGIGLAGLPEVRSPVTLVTGDTEVLSKTDRRNVRVLVGNGPVPLFKTLNTHSKEYQTVSHAEAFVSTSRSMEWKAPNIPIYRIGPLYVVGKISLTADIGADSAPNDRLLRGAPAGWPSARSGIPTDLSELGLHDGHRYYDGAWTLTSFSPGPAAITANSGTWLDRTFQPWDPFLARAIEDADHVLVKETNIGLSVGLGAGLGFSWNRWGVEVKAGIEVDGAIKGTVGQIHEIRESAYGEMLTSTSATHFDPSMQPLTGIVVAPKTRADLDFNSSAFVYFKVRLRGLGTLVDWKYDIYNVNVDLATWESERWPEENRFRLGTGAPVGDVMKQPAASSHWPQSTHFASFPMDVVACLADDRPVPDEPPPCEPTDDPADGIPSAELCVYGPLDDAKYPAACANIDGYVTAIATRFNAEQLTCIKESLKFLCQPVSRTQSWHGQRVVSRVIETGNDAFLTEMTTVMDQCGAAFGGTADAVRDRFGVGVCDDTARLLEGDDILDTSGSASEPPIGDGTCG